jgi:isocitrate dehydrogenase kinase/phosphatase
MNNQSKYVFNPKNFNSVSLEPKKRKQIKYVLTTDELIKLDKQVKKLNTIQDNYYKLCKYSRIDTISLNSLKEETSNVLISLGDLTINDLWINKRHDDFYYYVDNVKEFAWDLIEIISMKLNQK